MGGFLKQYGWIIEVASILLCSFFLAKIVGIYAGKAIEVKRSVAVMSPAETMPAEKKKAELADYAVITERNIFDSSGVGKPEKGEEGLVEEEIPTGEAVKTSLSLKIFGVLVVGEGRDSRSTATISSGGGSVGGKGGGSGGKVYAVGDEESFSPGTKLTRIQPDRIEFINNGRLEYAEVMGDMGPDIFGPPKREAVAGLVEPAAGGEKKETLVKKEAPGKFSVDQKEIDDALQNLDKLYTEIRAVPNFSGGKVSGMKILSVKGDSLFAKLGLRRGDVLQKINGLELDVKNGFEVFNKLKDQKSIQLDLVRGGAATTLDYEIR